MRRLSAESLHDRYYKKMAHQESLLGQAYRHADSCREAYEKLGDEQRRNPTIDIEVVYSALEDLFEAKRTILRIEYSIKILKEVFF